MLNAKRDKTMDDMRPSYLANDKPSSNMKLVGIILLALGVILSGWIVHTIFQIISVEGASSIVKRIIDMGEIDRRIIASSETIILPESLFYTIGIIILVLLLSISAGISKALIYSGIKILQPDISRTLKEIKKEIRDKKEKQNLTSA
jgi:arginine repressor